LLPERTGGVESKPEFPLKCELFIRIGICFKLERFLGQRVGVIFSIYPPSKSGLLGVSWVSLKYSYLNLLLFSMPPAFILISSSSPLEF
jgi:hypothetical protein